MPDSDRLVPLRGIEQVGDLVVTGTLNLQGVGKIVTSTDTAATRVIISATELDRIEFWVGSGDAGEQAGAVLATPSETLQLTSPSDDALDHPAYVTLTPAASSGQTVAAFGANAYPILNGVFSLGSTNYGWKDLYLTGVVKSTAGATLLSTAGAQSVAISASTYDPNLGILSGTTLPSVGTGGNAREQGIYSRIGSLVQAHVTITWSSDGDAGNGVYRVSPPKKIHTGLIVGGSVGAGRIIDASEGDTWVVECRKAGTTSVNLRITSTGVSNVTNSNPFTCGSSDDQFDLNLHYLTTET